MANNTLSIATAVVLVILLGLLTDPFMLWMPPMAAMFALLGAAALAVVWGGFVLYEKAGDERDEANRMYADRVAYLAGVAVLTIALVVQGFAHAINPWIPATLGVMVLAKLATRIYTEQYR
jgi:hypothetical protein